MDASFALPAGTGVDERRFRRRSLAGDGEGPGQDLDFQIGHNAVVLGLVLRLEGCAQDFGVSGFQRARRQGDFDLVALADVAHIGVTLFLQIALRRAEAHNRKCLLVHFLKEGVQVLRRKGRQGHVAAADHFVGNGCAQEADRRTDAGVGRHDDLFDAKLFRQPRGVQRRRAAEGDHGALGDFLAPLHRMDPGRIGHALVHHLADGQRRRGGVHGQRLTHVFEGRLLRRFLGERDLAVGEVVRVETAKQQVSIGHRRMDAALLIAGRARVGAGAGRAHLHAVQFVAGGNGAAAGADLHHLDHRDFHRQTAALHETVGAVHLEGAGEQRLALVDHADLGGGAAHIEGDHRVFAELTGDLPGQDGAARRPGFHQANGKGRGGFDGDETAAGGHEEAGAGKTGCASSGPADRSGSAPSWGARRRWHRWWTGGRTPAPRGKLPRRGRWKGPDRPPG